jgi:phage gp16-like protein
LKGFEIKQKNRLSCVKRRAGTAQIKLAPVNDVEVPSHVCAATKQQRKDYGKQGFHARCANADARAFPESAKSA